MVIPLLPVVCQYTAMGCCTGYDDAAANSFLQSTTGQQVQQRWAAASSEKDLQACLNKIVPQILSKFHGESRKYWDTSGKSESVVRCYYLAVIATSILVRSYVLAGSGLRGTELCIDCTVSDGPCCPAHVVTYAEAKFKLVSPSDQAEAVGQLWVSILVKLLLLVVCK